MAERKTPDADVPMSAVACVYCLDPVGPVVWQEAGWRIVRADEPLFPATYRIVCGQHVAELSDLPEPALHRGLALAMAVERALRDVAGADKINIASLGNQVPHLHWHVIARHVDDTHFPDPVWSPPRRPADAERLAARRAALPAVDAAVTAALHRSAPVFSGRTP